MGAIRITSGAVTLSLTGDLAKRMEERVRAATEGVTRELEKAFEAIATHAESEWYGAKGVQRRTGVSGTINVVTSVDIAASTANVSIGSAATEIVQLTGTGGSKRTGNRPRAVFVHSPSILSKTYRSVTVEDYWKTPPDLRGPFTKPAKWPKDAGFQPLTFPVVVDKDFGELGHGFLLEKLVKAPTRKAIKAIVPKLAKAATGGK